jgi:hypothetical protein
VKLTEEWKRLAGIYQRSVDAVRAADWNPRVTEEEYGALIDAREAAFAALAAESRRSAKAA